MLTYNAKTPEEEFLEPKQIDKHTWSYIVPVPEFVVDRIEIKQDDVNASFEYKLQPKDSGSILIVISGEAQVLKDDIYAGYVGFIPAVTSLMVQNIKSPLLIYRAYCRLPDGRASVSSVSE